jgi:hypothetical protein
MPSSRPDYPKLILQKNRSPHAGGGGCSELEIMSITGHRSLTEVGRYRRAANKKKLATAAILKLEQNANGTASAKRPPTASAKQKPMG